MKVAAMDDTTHNPFNETHWVSCLRENLTSSSYGEGLETGDECQHRASPLPDSCSLRRSNHRRIKTFIGTSENAVRIQIWTALIAMLLLRLLHLRSTWRWSFSNLVALLRQQIFVYRDLWKWLNQPDTPPQQIDDAQLGFAWPG